MDLAQLFPLVEATRYFPGRHGRRVSAQTIYRWAGRGLRGTKLRSIRMGGQTCTCDAWVRQFVAHLNRDTHIDSPSDSTSSDVEVTRRARVNADLDVAGF
jgi:hypothetical protein